MSLNRAAVAFSLGLLVPLSAAAIAQTQGNEPTTLVSPDATIDWYQQSNVSALRPGVIDKIELRIGKEVGRAGDEIGRLHRESALLAVKEAEIQAKGMGALQKAQAQVKMAVTVVNRNRAMNQRIANSVSQEEVQKAEAEFLVARAGEVEALDTMELAKAKLETAKQVAEEHIIRAPYAGIVIEELKHEGESVQANEAVVRIGNLDKVRVWTYIPVEYGYRVTVGTEIEIQVRLPQTRGKVAPQPIEQKKFRGVVTFVDPSVQAIGETGIRVYALIDNPTHELQPGYKAIMTFNLNKSDGGATLANPGAPEATASGALPALPR